MTVTPRAALATLCCLTFLVAACGSDDDPGDEAGAPAAVEGPDADADETGEGPGDPEGSDEPGVGESPGSEAGPPPEACPAVGTFEGTLERQADAASGHVAVRLDGADATDVIASEFFDLYSLNIADHAIDRGPLDRVLEGSISSDDPVLAADGGTVATIGFGHVQDGGSLAAGDVLTTEAYDLTVILDSGGGNTLPSGGDDGSLEVLHVSDDAICVTIDYRDPQVSVTGTVHAALYDGSN